jgi:hypothetical protein
MQTGQLRRAWPKSVSMGGHEQTKEQTTLWTNTTPVRAALVGLWTVASAAPAAIASDLNVPVLTPGKGVSFDFGSKRAVGYFLNERGTCKVTLMLAEAAREEGALPPTAARVNVSVAPGNSARVDADGKALEFVCRASYMTVKTVEAIAQYSRG